MNKPCPFCGTEPLTYNGKKTGRIWVHCHNNTYNGVQGVECPLVDRSFTVEEWNYRPHEDVLLERLMRSKKLLQDAINGTRDNWNDWLNEISEEFS